MAHYEAFAFIAGGYAKPTMIGIMRKRLAGPPTAPRKVPGRLFEPYPLSTEKLDFAVTTVAGAQPTRAAESSPLFRNMLVFTYQSLRLMVQTVVIMVTGVLIEPERTNRIRQCFKSVHT